MPCRGPCGEMPNGQNFYLLSPEEQAKHEKLKTPICYLDDGHSGGHSWHFHLAENPMEQMRDAAENEMIQVKASLKILLCSACRTLERYGYDFDENPTLSQWWDRHKKEDLR